jgi:hypothetical protein
MFAATMRSMVVFALACAVPLAGAQSLDAQRDFNERQLRDRLDREREAQRSREDQLNWDSHMNSLERQAERDRNSSQGSGGGDASSLAPLLLFAIIGGALIEWSRKPQAQRPAVDYVKETRRQRQDLLYRQCRNIRQQSLVYPKYEKPNTWAAIRLFQSNRAEEFQAAVAKYQTALAESEPTCRCVGERSVSETGFSDPEWRTIAANPRAERPWMAVDEVRARAVFEACAASSPSDPGLSWLYATAAR